MRVRPETPKPSADRVVRDSRRKTRKRHSTEEKIRIVLDGLRGEDSIAELRRREGISQSVHYSWTITWESGGSDPLLNKLQSSAFQPIETWSPSLKPNFWSIEL